MVPKLKSDSSDDSALKKRKASSMEVKLDIIKHLEKGETLMNIGQVAWPKSHNCFDHQQ